MGILLFRGPQSEHNDLIYHLITYEEKSSIKYHEEGVLNQISVAV